MSEADRLTERIARLGDALSECRNRRADRYRTALGAGGPDTYHGSKWLMQAAQCDRMIRQIEESRAAAVELLQQLEEVDITYRCDRCKRPAVPNGRGGYEHAEAADAAFCGLLAGAR